ncbi:DUF4175 family protein [Paracoccus suum]|uniref:DUF4175 family protein n=2 Tax=Paracoccus suum TaxID=2259340 RepID=A0A344PNT2_9RHOB|nr:DUF4175 family protein [Paracoccus suum]
MWWEGIARGLWLAFVWAALGIAAFALGAGNLLAPDPLGWVVAGWLALLALAIAWGLWRLRRPSPGAVQARVDAALPGRPLSALGDEIAVGAGDGDSAALWQAHRVQMWQAAQRARPARPRPGLARRDPIGLRLAALTALAMAVLFGSTTQLGHGLGAIAATLGGPLGRTPAVGPGWEGWAAPPEYTRRPVIYLSALPEDEVLRLPKGSRVSFRLYGGDAGLTQDIGPAAADTPPEAPVFTAEHTGAITVAGRRFAVEVLPDDPPVIAAGAAPQRRADGRLVQAFTAGDDNGVVSAEASVVLDLAAVDRRYGLAVDPDPRDPLVLALPLPARGSRTDIKGSLIADLSRHPLANLPVTVSLRARDGIDQQAEAPPMHTILPGRRFFDPLAAALIEVRRDLLWSRTNAGRSAQILRAISWQPQGLLEQPAVDALRGVIGKLEYVSITPQVRDDIAEVLWNTAVQIEDGGLADALEAMQRAQERLSEAIRNGATPDEIKRLMSDLKTATDAYTQMLAEQGEADPNEKFVKNQPGQKITGDQIQAMMDEIERLMNEGRTAEAQELLEQFNRMMENLKVTQGQGGEGGQGSPQRRLADTLREQQRLADDAMRQLQDDFMGTPGDSGQAGQPGGMAGEQPGMGQSGEAQTGEAQTGEGQTGEGQSGQGQSGQGEVQGQPGGGQPGEGQSDQPGGDGPGGLADRQRALRDQLGTQRGMLPGPGSDEGEAARRELDRAGKAMGEAEDALRGGDPGGAMDRQAEAIEAMREGLRALGRLQGEGEGQGQTEGAPEQGPEGSRPGGRSDPGQAPMPYLPRPPTDPLGRDTTGSGSTVTTGDGLPETGRDPARRAHELLDEIRRRSGELTRPEDERSYLRRLLDQF